MLIKNMDQDRGLQWLLKDYKIIAKGSSVDGSITSKLFGLEGDTHLPFI